MILALAAEEDRLKTITPSTNSARENTAPLLITQGADFNYTANTAFKNTLPNCKGRWGVGQATKRFYRVTTVPSTGKCGTSQGKGQKSQEELAIMEILLTFFNINNKIQVASLQT